MPNRREDWASIRAEYVTGIYPSLRKTAQAHDIHPATLTRRARMEDEQGMTWDDHRQSYLSRTSDKAMDILADQDAVQFAARQAKILGIADMIAELFLKQRVAFEDQIAAGKIPISVRDMAIVAELVKSITGPPKDKEEKSGGLSLVQLFNGTGQPANSVIPSGAVRELAAALRSRATESDTGSGTTDGVVEAPG